MMERVSVYEVYRNEDGTEGRGPQVLLGRYTTEAMAIEAGVGKDVMGTDAKDIREATLYKDGERYFKELIVLEETDEIRRRRELDRFRLIKATPAECLTESDIEFMEKWIERAIEKGV